MSRMTDMCDIACDSCGEWQPGVYASTREQRNLLIRLGWTYTKNENGMHDDLCPKCSKDERDE